MNRLKNYEKILSEKGLSDYPYIRKFILENESFDKPFVLGAGTSSGKTFMGIIWLELFYSNQKNKGLKTLVFPASTVVLRDNFADSLREFNPSFTYCICEDGDDIKSAIKSNCDVIVVLPQTAKIYENVLKGFHNFILDEAHQWYFEKTITSIIKKIKPKNQILLTGSPAPFVAKKENFKFQFVPVLELYELGKVSNVKIEVVSTSHDFKLSDYNRHNNLKNGLGLHLNAENELAEVCKEMVKKLKNPIKGYQSFNNITKNTIGGLFNFLEKTIIFCHSKKQANEFYKVLSKMKELEDRVLISHSESDKESLEFRNFKEQSKYQILIAVDRGKLGFNIPDLFNVIDFTFTQNLSMLLQMYGRLLRLSKSNKPKIFYKVAPKNMAPYFVDIVTALCCLFDSEWYSKFNGKNMDEIVIRKVSISKKRGNTNTNNTPKKSQNKLYSIEQLGIPLDLNLLKTNIKHSYDGKFVTVAETTLKDVRRKFFNITGINQFTYEYRSFDEARDFARNLKFKTKEEWIQFTKSKQFPKDIPMVPCKTESYKNDWKGWSDFLGADIVTHTIRASRFLPFDKAKEYMKQFNLRTEADFRVWRKNKPDFIPANPNRAYRNDNWMGFGEFLSGKVTPPNDRKFRPYKQTKKYVQSLGLKTQRDWINYANNNELPIDIPKTLEYVYKNEWEGWSTFLNSENARDYRKDPKTGKRYLVKK